jgi:hypothetical protein
VYGKDALDMLSNGMYRVVKGATMTEVRMAKLRILAWNKLVEERAKRCKLDMNNFKSEREVIAAGERALARILKHHADPCQERSFSERSVGPTVTLKRRRVDMSN